MSITQEEIDSLISGGLDKPDTDDDSGITGAEVESPQFPELEIGSKSPVYTPLDPKLELLYDLQLPISIELGRTNMLIRDILRLGRGSVIEFDKLISEPIDVLINNKKVAEGEVVVIDKHFGIRITTLIDPTDRIRAAKR